MPMRFLITGASGFIGGHMAEACVQRGCQVVAITRTTSDTALLEKIPATILKGELSDPQLVRRALEEVDVVVHCAGKVGNWGPLEDYRPLNVEALRGLLEACKYASRFWPTVFESLPNRRDKRERVQNATAGWI